MLNIVNISISTHTQKTLYQIVRRTFLLSLNHPNWNKSSSTALFRVENQIHNQNYSKFLHFLAQLNEEVNLKNEKKLISLSYLSKEKIIKLVFLFLHKSALIHLTEIYCHRHTLNRIGLFIYFVIQKKKQSTWFFVHLMNEPIISLFESAKWYWIYPIRR